MLTRREFTGHLAKGTAIVALGASLSLEGCGLVSDIENWVPVGIASMKSIELVLQSNGYPLSGTVLTAFNDVIAALNAVDAAATEYGSANPAPVGTLQKLQLAIKSVTDALATFLSELSLPGGGVLNLIIGLAGVLVSTIMAFLNQLPAAPATAMSVTLATRWRVGSAAFNVSPVHRTRRRFKSDFNSNLDSGKTVGVAVPNAAYLKLSLLEHF